MKIMFSNDFEVGQLIRKVTGNPSLFSRLSIKHLKQENLITLCIHLCFTNQICFVDNFVKNFNEPFTIQIFQADRKKRYKFVFR